MGVAVSVAGVGIAVAAAVAVVNGAPAQRIVAGLIAALRLRERRSAHEDACDRERGECQPLHRSSPVWRDLRSAWRKRRRKRSDARHMGPPRGIARTKLSSGGQSCSKAKRQWRGASTWMPIWASRRLAE